MLSERSVLSGSTLCRARASLALAGRGLRPGRGPRLPIVVIVVIAAAVCLSWLSLQAFCLSISQGWFFDLAPYNNCHLRGTCSAGTWTRSSIYLYAWD